MRYCFLVIIIALCHNCRLLGRPVSGFAQDSLEPNSGFYESQYLGNRTGPPVKSDLYSFKISSDDRYLAFTGWSNTLSDSLDARIVVYDLRRKKVLTRISYSNISRSQFWFLDSNHLLYQSFGSIDTAGHSSIWYVKLNLLTLERDSVGGAGWTSNMIIGNVGSDRMGYLVNADGFSASRLLIDSCFASSKPLLSKIYDYSGPVVCGKRSSYVPHFPPCTCDYAVTPIMECDSSQRYYCQGFAFIYNYDYQHQSSKWYFSSIPVSDTSRVLQLQTAYSFDNYSLGSNGDIFFELGNPNRIISKREIAKGLPERFESNPFDSVMLSARSTWGYYRVDSSGKNLTQLVREWWGSSIQASCTGRIYYVVYSLYDSCASIWSMDRNGLDKNKIYTLGQQDASNAVEELYDDGKVNSVLLNSKCTEIQFRRNPKEMCRQYIVYNIMGGIAASNTSNDVDAMVTIDVSNLSDGVYFIRSGCNEERSLLSLFVIR